MCDWVDVLDGFEANLDLAEHHLETGTPAAAVECASLVQPKGLMPMELAQRADNLLGRALDLEQAISDRMYERCYDSRPPPTIWHRARRGRLNTAS